MALLEMSKKRHPLIRLEILSENVTQMSTCLVYIIIAFMSPNAGTMLGHRRRRWANIVLTLDELSKRGQ